MPKSSRKLAASPGASARRLLPDPIPPAIGFGDVVFLLVPVTVRQLTHSGYVVINATGNVNKIAQRHELRTARELGL